MQMEHRPYTLWYGEQSSYDVIAKAREGLKLYLANLPNNDNAKLDLPSLYTRHGDVGVINIKGSLHQGYTGAYRLWGVLGYDDIQEALFEGLRDKKAKRMVLDIDSPGGAVKGLANLAANIRTASQVKPITAFAETANSAAYWLASATNHIVVGDMGEVGSIGCIAVHTEYSKAYANEGVVKTAIRSDENKAVISNFEPLTEHSRGILQASVNKARDMFVSAIAEYRGVTRSTVETQYGKGLVFTGAEALGPGLADAVGGFDDAAAWLHKA